VAGVAVLVLTGAAVYLLPKVWGHRLGNLSEDAQWVVFLLGTSLALQVAFNAFIGVITGCHRWDLHNAIHAGGYVITVGSMITVLYLGRGLRSLALCSLVGLLLTDLVRVAVVFRLCPWLRIAPRFVERAVIWQALTFGGKTIVPRISELLLHQTAALLITVFLGPAALALYSRPMSLARHVGTAVHKLAFVLTPTASALQATEHLHALQDLLVRATRYAAFISLPMTLILLIMGGPVMLLWMGPDYADALLVAALAAGSLPLIAFSPAMSILAGLNAHGKPGVAHLVAAIVAVGLVLFALGYLRWGTTGVALAIGSPMVLVYGVYVPVHSCRSLRLPFGRYMMKSFSLPLLCAAPFAACLLAARFVWAERPLVSLAVGLGSGGLVLGTLYWRHVLPGRYRRGILRVLGVTVHSA
jgi:O-antigen/teichoic acid export membrane protein